MRISGGGVIVQKREGFNNHRAIGHLVLGTTPPFMSWGHDDDEFKKRFDTMLLASPAMLVMDNCSGRVLRGDTLEMILSGRGNHSTV
jgi:hypothetical protein